MIFQLWFRGIRPSKFRHVYGLPSRKEFCYTDIGVVRSGNDGNFCSVNPKFLAIVADIAFVVIPITQVILGFFNGIFVIFKIFQTVPFQTGRIDFQCCKVLGHTGQVLDLKWNPFDDNVIASASDDCTIKLWKIPDGGLTTNLTECISELTGHKRKVMHIEWHPTVNNVIISAGFDNLVSSSGIIIFTYNFSDKILFISDHCLEL
jgi:coronin-2